MAHSDIDEHSSRMQILELIEKGRITADEGLHLLQALNEADADADRTGEEAHSERSSLTLDGLNELPPQRLTGMDQEIPHPSPAFVVSTEPDNREPDRHSGKDKTTTFYENKSEVFPHKPQWKRWWMIPLWIGVAVAVFGGFFMFLARRSSGIGLWFICAAVPFTFGLILIVLSWQSRRSPWLHLRVKQPPGEWPEKFAFSMPLPVQPASWFFRTFGKHFQGLESQNLEQVIRTVGEKTSPENPISIHVGDPFDGEQVDIYIG